MQVVGKYSRLVAVSNGQLYLRGVVYLLRFPNGKIYVGKTDETALARFKGHVRKSKNPTTPVHKAIKSFGPESVELGVLAGPLPPAELLEAEKQFIKQLRSQNPSIGYNLLEGGQGYTTEYLVEKWKDPDFCRVMREAYDDPERSRKISEGVKAAGVPARNARKTAARNKGVAPLDARIVSMSSRNPRQYGTPGYLVFRLYETGLSIREVIERAEKQGLGERRGPGQSGTIVGRCIRRDVREGYITISSVTEE